MKKLVVIPSEEIQEYIDKGHTRLREYYNPGGYFNEVYLLSPKEKFAREQFGMKIIPVSSARDYAKKIESIKPDIVRAYGGYWANLYANKYTPENYPVLVSLHDTDPLICFDFIRYSSHVICMTGAVKRLAISKGVLDSKISILPNRVTLNDFRPNTSFSEEWKIFQNEKYILHIGRRGPQKNLETVIKSLGLIPDEIKLISIGQGDNSNYESLAKKNNVLDRCIFIDSIRNDQISQFYSNAIAFVLPTRWEGFGVVFIEAASCGVPIIASNIAPINEILKNGENALLVDNFDSYIEISKAINYLLSNNSLRSKLSVEGIKLSKRYERESVNKLEIEIYKKVISEFTCRVRPNNIFSFSKSIKSIISYSVYRVRNKINKVFFK
ncbi:glycosyltransferase family 4 protein [Vibrio cholerae]|nr:glycosyltransferase family 4 protein [Vibrio cholerae]EMC3731294.1 glycosyltransferase family 4 protein [Vibrio cholerae]